MSDNFHPASRPRHERQLEFPMGGFFVTIAIPEPQGGYRWSRNRSPHDWGTGLDPFVEIWPKVQKAVWKPNRYCGRSRSSAGG
jgi:hypothetical protein